MKNGTHIRSLLQPAAPKRFQAFASDQAGATAIIFGLASLVMVTAGAAAVDYTSLSRKRTELQRTADAAALAGARALALSAGWTNSQREQAAVLDAAGVVQGLASGAQKVITPSLTSRTVRVDVTSDQVLAFGGVLGRPTQVVAVTATATYADVSSACILALAVGQPTGIATSGASSLEAPKCTVWSNATSSTSVSFRGKSVVARRICAVGGASGSSPPSAQTGCQSYSDPFASLDISSISTTCQYPAQSVTGGATATFQPGVYCGSIRIAGTATFQPGIYVIKDGVFTIDGSANVSGSGVSFLLMGTSSLAWTGKGRIKLSPMTSGPLAGLVIASDPTGPSVTSELSGDGDLATLEIETTGSIYLPRQMLRIWGNGSTTLSGAQDKLVVRQIEVGGSAKLATRADDLAQMKAAESTLRLSH
ncbi:TadE/TadG family type IV pilus assembly protein [Salinarimonas soli]|uniref:Putative Flp pilus-assembly TadG-like N-terminal domain-containing protein n=1 Tax=Salinarimonas soli TaxID=1638099 RepID=A0A5B2VSB8_9HYPH|nr:pilus assembly protein TadG-related protein [Salinarimonas soli]KAA2241142.1 hypothetical protein F0L46_04915 [Salinarimonas soli]